MIYYSDCYSSLELPLKHRFPIQKYRKLYEQLLITPLKDYVVNQSPSISTDIIKRCHDSHYVEAFIKGQLSEKEIKKIGFPWSELLVKRTLSSLGNTEQAALTALSTGWAVNLSGGYHHAHHNYGSGYCIFNDFVVIARHLLDSTLVDKVLIFDCDVHQGDGTATMCHDYSDIVTCSIHCEQNFPKLKALSDMDFALTVNTSDDDYLMAVKESLTLAIRLHQPDIILYNAGADIYKKDELGLFDISLEGIRARDSIVLSTCLSNHLPIVCALGGGYIRDESKLIEAHMQLFSALLDNLELLV